MQSVVNFIVHVALQCVSGIANDVAYFTLGGNHKQLYQEVSGVVWNSPKER